MSIPKPNLHPPFNIVRLSHVEFGVADLAKSRAFYVDTLGLQVTDETPEAIYLRGLEERGHHCMHVLRSQRVLQAAPERGQRKGHAGVEVQVGDQGSHAQAVGQRAVRHDFAQRPRIAEDGKFGAGRQRLPCHDLRHIHQLLDGLHPDDP